jgi:hypothetical protein
MHKTTLNNMWLSVASINFFVVIPESHRERMDEVHCDDPELECVFNGIDAYNVGYDEFEGKLHFAIDGDLDEPQLRREILDRIMANLHCEVVLRNNK